MKEKGFVFQGMATCGKVNMWVKLIENEDDFNNVVCVCVCVCVQTHLDAYFQLPVVSLFSS